MAAEIISKRCPKCKETKPVSEFSKNRKQYDGLQTWCKSCKRVYQQNEKGRAIDCKASAKYRRTPNGKATMKRFYARHPNYVKAKHAVSNAIRDGRLPPANTRLCHYCPKPAEQYHHHKGYEPECWLDVVPVCRNCHTKVHRKIA